MPPINPESPTREVEFAGVKLITPDQYSEGHALTANEAIFVNRQLSSVVGNMFAGWVRRQLTSLNDANLKAAKSKDAAEKAKAVWDTDENGKNTLHIFTIADLNVDFQAEYTSAFTDYEPGVSNRGSGGAASSDPIARFARNIASGKINELLKAKGKKAKDFHAESTKDESGHTAHQRLVADYIARNAWVTELAKSQVAAMAQHAEGFDIDAALGGSDAASEAVQPEASAEQPQPVE